MKKYFKTAVVLLLIFITTFSMVACKKPPMVDIDKVEDDLKNGAKPEGEITFTYSPAATSADYKQAADKFVGEFEKKYTDVKVTRDYTVTTDNRIATADIGDVFYFAEVQTYKYAVKDKALLPLDTFIEHFEIDTSDIYAGIYGLGLVNGRLYFVPRDYNQIALIYNKSAITENGLTADVKPEWSWENFLEICRTITEGSDGYYGAKVNLTYSPVYVPFFEAYKNRNAWCNTTEKKITFIDDDNSILKAIGDALEAAKKGFININTVNDSQVTGEAVFSTIVYPQVQAEGKKYDQLQVDWDVINMPLFQNPSFGCGASGVGVFSRTQNPTAAAALSLFFFDSEGQKAFNSGTGGSVPILKSLDQSGYNAWKYPDDEAWSTKNWDAFVYLADTASTTGQVNCRMPIEVADAIEEDIAGIFKKDIAGTQSYTDGFRALENKCNEIWGKLTSVG